MGLDASVMCNCYKEGRTTPPPVPVKLIHMDQEGYLRLDLPYDKENWPTHNLFEDWMKHCCDHYNMKYASVRVSNWPGYRAFQQALSQADWQHFPTHKAELPNANGGLMSAASAAKALQELSYFKAHADLGTNTFLINTETDEVIYEYIAGYDGIFLLSGRSGVDIGFDNTGFFIVTTSEPAVEVFRSTRFEQRLLEPELTGLQEEGVEYVDLETTRRFVCTAKVSGKVIPWPDGRMQDAQGNYRFEYPRYMHIEERKIDASNFSYILDPLTEIFQAAVATENPVRWE